MKNIKKYLPLLALATACEEPPTTRDWDGDGYTNDIDCNDLEVHIYPGAKEICNAIDDNCDSLVDNDVSEEDLLDWYIDQDGDGYGSAEKSIRSCIKPEGHVQNSEDCNDQDPSIHPTPMGTGETSPNPVFIQHDGIDNDCDGTIDVSYTIPKAPERFTGLEPSAWRVSLSMEDLDFACPLKYNDSCSAVSVMTFKELMRSEISKTFVVASREEQEVLYDWFSGYMLSRYKNLSPASKEAILDTADHLIEYVSDPELLKREQEYRTVLLEASCPSRNDRHDNCGDLFGTYGPSEKWKFERDKRRKTLEVFDAFERQKYGNPDEDALRDFLLKRDKVDMAKALSEGGTKQSVEIANLAKKKNESEERKQPEAEPYRKAEVIIAEGLANEVLSQKDFTYWLTRAREDLKAAQ